MFRNLYADTRNILFSRGFRSGLLVIFLYQLLFFIAMKFLYSVFLKGTMDADSVAFSFPSLAAFLVTAATLFISDREFSNGCIIRIMKESHCDALKLEGGVEIIDTVKKILDAGIPVCGHLGLTPQSINKFGTYTVRAREEAEAEKLVSDAHALEEVGCFAVVLEKIPAALAARVTSELKIPVIGIGAGGACDGQVLVVADMLGMSTDFSPKFLRRYADLNTIMTEAIGNYITDVKSGDFPNENEQY